MFLHSFLNCSKVLQKNSLSGKTDTCDRRTWAQSVTININWMPFKGHLSSFMLAKLKIQLWLKPFNLFDRCVSLASCASDQLFVSGPPSLFFFQRFVPAPTFTPHHFLPYQQLLIICFHGLIFIQATFNDSLLSIKKRLKYYTVSCFWVSSCSFKTVTVVSHYLRGMLLSQRGKYTKTTQGHVCRLSAFVWRLCNTHCTSQCRC